MDLNLQRAKANPGQLGQQLQTNSSGDPFELLTNWQPRNGLSYDIAADFQVLQCAAQGFRPAMAMVSWLRQCTWPTEPPNQTALPTGISWSEIALAVSLEMGTFLPVKRRKADSDKHTLVWLESYQQARLQAVTFSELAEMASQLLRQVAALLPCEVLPSLDHGRVRSLYLMGDCQATTGLIRRPAWPSQHRVVHLIKKKKNYMQGGGRCRT